MTDYEEYRFKFKTVGLGERDLTSNNRCVEESDYGYEIEQHFSTKVQINLPASMTK